MPPSRPVWAARRLRRDRVEMGAGPLAVGEQLGACDLLPACHAGPCDRFGGPALLV
ncbi:hypothetical protein VWBp46 [Streptomyces phage VWB]|uniref:Uncharacterized protein n=1 Tax=Streptomyces phage VWB TaxID=10702 RepID=Q6VY43_9CAUD|nr:hypothetical protein VWBp46 [Streptomyces phage VWB]AAR29736.1 hypothetical protein [Streptomyces phage VWB]